MEENVYPWPLNAVDLQALEQQWTELLQQAHGDTEQAAQLFRQLAALYGSADRYYHTLGHVRQVLATVDALGERAADPTALRLAAWYHDVIYDTHAADNEQQSADYAARALRGAAVDPATVATIAALILETRHNGQPTDGDSAIIRDADLAAFAAEHHAYCRQSAAIRCEYAWVPEGDYRRSRATILHAFLGRERIFFTTELFSTLEQRARHNISGEIRSLETTA